MLTHLYIHRYVRSSILDYYNPLESDLVILWLWSSMCLFGIPVVRLLSRCVSRRCLNRTQQTTQLVTFLLSKFLACPSSSNSRNRCSSCCCVQCYSKSSIRKHGFKMTGTCPPACLVFLLARGIEVVLSLRCRFMLAASEKCSLKLSD